ncbi:MAG: hypothetical protein IPG32_10775 [Saprospirales bacterium]|nr:hypothetical protein [Saprospirales bacterium]
MFYDVCHVIEKEDRYEVEVDMVGGESLIAGLVKLNPDNIEYSIQHIINSNLRFVYIVKRDSKNAPANWNEFLRQIVDCRLTEERQTFLHIPKVIANHADEERSLMYLTTNGGDDEIIQFWVLDPELRKILSELETRYRSQVEN